LIPNTENQAFVDRRQDFLKGLSPEVLLPLERLPSEERNSEEERLFETSLPEDEMQAAQESFEKGTAGKPVGEFGIDAGSYSSYGSYADGAVGVVIHQPPSPLSPTDPLLSSSLSSGGAEGDSLAGTDHEDDDDAMTHSLTVDQLIVPAELHYDSEDESHENGDWFR
jgi:hypothetical protein